MKMELRVYLTFSCVLLTVVARVLGCEPANCNSSNQTVCNERGTCDCGVCKCEGSYSGPTCEECPTCPSPCDVYRGCVGCKIFGTGPLGVMECILKCEDIATYIPEYKETFDNPTADDTRPLCMTLVEVLDGNKACMEMFRIGGMTDGYRDLFVRTESDCSVDYVPTNPPVIEVTLKPNDGETVEDAGAVSGSDQDQSTGGNSAEAKTVSIILLVLMMVSSFL